MFSITPGTEAGMQLLLLKDETLGTTVAINRTVGALLHAFSIPFRGDRLNVIAGYESADELADKLTDKGFRSCKLAPFAGRLFEGTYRWNDREYTCGRFMLGPHALHGLLYDAPFTESDIAVEEHAASVTLEYAYLGEEPGYPFPLDCAITYRLCEGNTLQIITRYSNPGRQALPLLDGWHPYFTLGAPVDTLELRMQTLEHIETDAQLIPTGAVTPYDAFAGGRLIEGTQFDDCYRLDMQATQPLITLTNSATGLRLEMQPGDGYPYVQVYTPPGRQTIAIENMSGVPDCFHNGRGLTVLEPGKTVEFSTQLTLHVSQV